MGVIAHYKVYVTERGLIPAEIISGGIKELCIEEKLKNSDMSYQAWLVAYRKAGDYSDISFFEQDMFEKYDDNEKFLPIIHVCVSNDFTEEDPDGKVARYAQITDSSIWNYFVKAHKEDGHIVAPTLKNVVDTIRKNYDSDKYCLMVAREYANLNYRLVKESRLVGDHATNVSPFLFHSEQKMHEKVEQLKQYVVNKQYRWKILLLDDCATNNRMDTYPKDVIKGKNKWQLHNDNKLSIVLDQLEECGFSCQPATYSEKLPIPPKLADDKNLLIFCTHTIDETKKVLMEEQFDIILLDYKLKGEYSYQFLKEISESPLLKRHAGIIGKYYFMYISAYTTAIQERLLEQQLTRNEDYWYIGESACPTNTPEMFKFYLLTLMKKRLYKSGILKLSNKNIIEEVKSIFSIDKDDNGRGRLESVRKLAYDEYKKVLSFCYAYSQLKESEGKSPLIDGFLKDKIHYGAMLEHLLQLIHLTAFGTVRQWPEIWEEYKFFIRTIDDKDGKYQNSIKEISEAIEQHVIDLKSE